MLAPLRVDQFSGKSGARPCDDHLVVRLALVRDPSADDVVERGDVGELREIFSLVVR